MYIKFHTNFLPEVTDYMNSDKLLKLMMTLPCLYIPLWPSTIKEIPQVLHPYWTFHKELTIEDGLILKGT